MPSQTKKSMIPSPSKLKSDKQPPYHPYCPTTADQEDSASSTMSILSIDDVSSILKPVHSEKNVMRNLTAACEGLPLGPATVNQVGCSLDSLQPALPMRANQTTLASASMLTEEVAEAELAGLVSQAFEGSMSSDTTIALLSSGAEVLPANSLFMEGIDSGLKHLISSPAFLKVAPSTISHKSLAKPLTCTDQHT